MTEQLTPRHRDPETGEQWYSTQQVAELLGRTRQTIRNWARSGRMKHRRTPAGYIEIPRSEVEKYSQIRGG